MSRKNRRRGGDDEDRDSQTEEEIEETVTEYVDAEGNPVGTTKNGNRIVVFMKTHQNKWIAVFICAGLILLLFIFLYWAWFDQAQTQNHHHMHQLDMRLDDREMGRNSFSVAQSSLYSLASVLGASRRSYTLALCHRASYDPVQRDRREVLVPSDMNARAQALVQRQINTLPKNSLLDVRLEMRYNVEVAPDVLVKNGLSPTQRYQTLHYELASNYAGFSSIKLLVSSEDIYRQVPRVRQEVLICSNRPDSERRCSRSVSDNKLRMNNTLLFPMEQAVQPQPEQQEDPSARPGRQQAQQTEEPEQPQRGIDLVDQDKENLRGLESNLANNRQFHILFYMEASTSSRTAATSRDDNDYNEYIALTVEPAMC